MIKSKLTTRSRTTIPRPVREALGVGPGDEVSYQVGTIGAEHADGLGTLPSRVWQSVAAALRSHLGFGRMGR